MTKTRHKKSIPEFRNRKEMARWFDIHDMTDYNFKPADVAFDLEKPKEETVMFRLDRGVKQYISKVASSKGLSISSLLRMWVMDRVNQIHRA